MPQRGSFKNCWYETGRNILKRTLVIVPHAQCALSVFLNVGLICPWHGCLQDRRDSFTGKGRGSFHRHENTLGTGILNLGSNAGQCSAPFYVLSAAWLFGQNCIELQLNEIHPTNSHWMDVLVPQVQFHEPIKGIGRTWRKPDKSKFKLLKSGRIMNQNLLLQRWTNSKYRRGMGVFRLSVEKRLKFVLLTASSPVVIKKEVPCFEVPTSSASSPIRSCIIAQYYKHHALTAVLCWYGTCSQVMLQCRRRLCCRPTVCRSLLLHRIVTSPWIWRKSYSKRAQCSLFLFGDNNQKLNSHEPWI